MATKKIKTPLRVFQEWLIERWSDPSKMLSCGEISDKINSLKEADSKFVNLTFHAGALFSGSMSAATYQGKHIELAK